MVAFSLFIANGATGLLSSKPLSNQRTPEDSDYAALMIKKRKMEEKERKMERKKKMGPLLSLPNKRNRKPKKTKNEFISKNVFLTRYISVQFQ